VLSTHPLLFELKPSYKEQTSTMKRRQKTAACVHCRQMKVSWVYAEILSLADPEIQLGCDGHQKFPAACSRCARSGLHCSVDPSFKRTARREYVSSLWKSTAMQFLNSCQTPRCCRTRAAGNQAKAEVVARLKLAATATKREFDSLICHHHSCQSGRNS